MDKRRGTCLKEGTYRDRIPCVRNDTPFGICDSQERLLVDREVRVPVEDKEEVPSEPTELRAYLVAEAREDAPLHVEDGWTFNPILLHAGTELRSVSLRLCKPWSERHRAKEKRTTPGRPSRRPDTCPVSLRPESTSCSPRHRRLSRRPLAERRPHRQASRAGRCRLQRWTGGGARTRASRRCRRCRPS